MIVTSRDPSARLEIFKYLRSQGVEINGSEDFQGIGRVNKELAFRGAVGYNGFCGLSCSMHVAGTGNWVSRELLWMAFHYPFEQLKMNYIFGPVAADNDRAIRFNTHLGFEELRRFPSGWAEGIDLVVFGMARKDCRWLKRLA